MSDRDYFETKEFVIGPCGPFYETYHMFRTLHVIAETNKPYICKATCAYTDVWKTIYTKYVEPEPDSIYLFFSCAHDWDSSPLTRSEHEPFTIDDRCKPLFDQFIKEEYVEELMGQYFWTPKIRPYFEDIGYWRSKNEEFKLRQRSIIADMTATLKEELHKFASKNDKLSAIAHIKKSAKAELPISWDVAQDIIEIMFPEVWGNKPIKPLHWKWYGEVPSQGDL